MSKHLTSTPLNGFGFAVLGFGFRVTPLNGFGFRVLGFGFSRV